MAQVSLVTFGAGRGVTLQSACCLNIEGCLTPCCRISGKKALSLTLPYNVATHGNPDTTLCYRVAVGAEIISANKWLKVYCIDLVEIYLVLLLIIQAESRSITMLVC